MDHPVAGPSAHEPPGAPKRALSDPEGEDASEDDEGRGSEAPKKRRRRQALSCTECKRRKIKCDRQHPCGPCVRRSEADKCHWNIVEPADKYVLRSEWDAVQRRLSSLEERPAERSPPDPAARIARLEAFLAALAPDAWTRFQDDGRVERTTRSDPLPRFQPFYPRPQSPPPPTHHHEHYARPLPPRGSSVEHYSPARLEGPLPGPRALGFPPAFSTSSESSGPSRYGDWDPQLSRVLPPPLPSHRGRPAAGTSASSTAFSEERRTSDPHPLGKYGSQPSDRKPPDDPGPPHVFVSFTMASDSDERRALLASVLAKGDAAVERGAVPDRPVCDLLVDHYFKRVAWNHNLICQDSFLESYRAFWNTPDVRPSFVALLLVVLCVSLGNMSPERSIRERICKDMAHRRRVCLGLWKGCQKALGASDMLKTKELEVVQALVMLMYCDQSLDDNGWEYYAPFIGLAVRIAHSLGLSKLGSEPVGDVPAPGLRERELKRRVWWNLVFIDWYLSPIVGHTYLVHPAQATTSLPSNVDWHELVDGVRFEPRDRKTYTSASFLIVKAEVAISVRELSDHINAGQPLTHEFLLAYERRLNERVALSPSALVRRDHVLEREDRVAWERIMLTFGLNHRAIRLHRRFMLRGYTVLEYRRSTESCVASAKAVLHTFQEAQAIDFPGTTWWVVCMVSFASAVVLLMDQFYACTAVGGDIPTPAEMELRRRHVHQAIQLLHSISETTTLARKGAIVLSALIEQVGRRRGPSPPDVHPSPYASAPSGSLGRLLSSSSGTNRAVESWVSEGLGVRVPDGELQGAPIASRSMDPETETFWTKVFELDFPLD